MTRRAGAIWLSILVLLLALLLFAPRAEPGSSTLALRRFLRASGLDVSSGGPPPPDGTFVLLHDLRTRDEAQSLLGWVADGGHLVVADAASAVVGLSGAWAGEPMGLVGARSLEPGCLAEEALGVSSIVARSSDRRVHGGDRFVSCFDGLLAIRAHGDGTIVLLGGSTAFTNEHLRRADNAALALRVTGHGPAVVFGAPTPLVAGAPSGGVWSALPFRARLMIATFAAAALVFAFVRGRRLGMPTAEAPIAPIPASELVRATARLYRRGSNAAYAGRLLREGARARLGRRFGVPEGDHDALPALAARATRLPPEHVEEALSGPEPRTDAELVRLGSLLAVVEERGEGAR